MLHVFGLVALVLPLLGQVPGKVDALQTVAERSDYRATARYDDVAAWCREFAKATPNAHLTELGRSSEGRSIPLLDRGRSAGQDGRRRPRAPASWSA